MDRKPWLVVMAGSTGGLAAFRDILGALPADFPAPILALLHLEPTRPSLAALLLGRRTQLTVREAKDGDRLVAGTVLVAPPDQHLVVGSEGVVRLDHTARVHFVRPAADNLFLSAAEAYGPAVIGVLCTGQGTDGGDGLLAIRRQGGVTLVQDPATSAGRGMPSGAIRKGAASFVLPLPEIPAKLMEIVSAS